MLLVQFRELVDLIQIEFSPATGSMAFCNSKRKKRTLSICCSCIRNTGMLASLCIVWYKENVKYEGKLNSYKLKNLLNRWGICRASITNVVRLETGDRGDFICLGCRETCKSRKCKLSPAYRAPGRKESSNDKSIGNAEEGE